DYLRLTKLRSFYYKKAIVSAGTPPGRKGFTTFANLKKPSAAMYTFFRFYRRDLHETLRLSVPIIIAQLGVVLMGVTDNLMIGRILGAVPLGASGIATSVTYMIGSIGFGGLTIVSALISQAKGRGTPGEVNRLYRAGIRVAWLLGVMLG